MSLKAFHIFFIAVSVLVAFAFSAWTIVQFSAFGETWTLVMGLLSAGVGVGLIVYGRRFLHKMKHVGYL